MDVLKTTLLIFLVFPFSMGCQITYLMKSAYNHVSIMSRRQPIDEVIKIGKLNADEKAKLEMTQRVRIFASEKLKLNVGKNYSTYVQLERPYVVWALNAAQQWKLEHHLWNFPIVGSVPYIGFPKESDALKEEDEMKKKGYDTYVRGVSAYSTLGWFDDPLLSSMMRYSEEDLVNTIIHESVHATLYIKSNADFNERLASFIGDKGTELYYLEMDGPESKFLKKIRDENDDQKIFSAFISEEIKNLSTFYRNHPQPNLPLREAQFADIKQRFNDRIRPQLKTNIHRNFDRLTLNNARLLLFKTYIADMSDFQRLLDSLEGDLVAFLNKVKSLESEPNPVDGLKKL